MVEIVPNRLFFSRLPSRDMELSCEVRLATAEQGARLSWALRGDSGRHTLASERPLREDERQRGAASISMVLPRDWPDSLLTVDLGHDVSAHEVRFFEQTQDFAIPLATLVLVMGGHRVGEPHRTALAIPSQQFGWDLVGLRPDGLALLKGELSDQLRSHDHACFGQGVLAPADGRVAAVVDGIADADLLGTPVVRPDNDVRWAVGNHVVIEHQACTPVLRTYGGLGGAGRVAGPDHPAQPRRLPRAHQSCGGR